MVGTGELESFVTTFFDKVHLFGCLCEPCQSFLQVVTLSCPKNVPGWLYLD